jgi:hypothetical protein
LTGAEGATDWWAPFRSFGGDPPPALVGDQVCGSCHADKLRSFHQTAHARTSTEPTADAIHGSFAAGANRLTTVNPNVSFTLEARNDGYFQTAHVRTSATEELTRTERIDVVVGSGRKGQTYLYWDGDLLFELPVSYWTMLDGWVNSPGYTDGQPDFDRPIIPRCLECHASSFHNVPPPENRYVKTSLVLGISCEKCHGPGAEHVARFRSAAPPKLPSDFAIVNPARLSRTRQLEVCALCHEGGGQSLVPPLSYTPGADLDKYLAFPEREANAPVDVHARQVLLLEKSRCFRASPTLTCVTCHDVHTPQRDAASFVARCLACHRIEDCRLFPQQGHRIDRGCVDCHMPLRTTAKIQSGIEGQTVQPKVRSHLIAIYPERAPP